MGSSPTNGNSAASGTAANLSYARFLFVVSRAQDDAHAARLRAVGGHLVRGFFNDFDLDDTRESAPQALESIQFFVRDETPEGPGRAGVDAAGHMLHVSSRYRPRLEDVGEELQRRLGDSADVIGLDGALRALRYSSAELQQYAYQAAPPRRSGRLCPHAIVLPTRKTAEWWAQDTLERHAYFYPHHDASSGAAVKGHAVAAERGIKTLHRRVYHNPDGYGRAGEFDFITYIECDAAGVPIVDEVLTSLRDVAQNPEWRYVEEGPMWRGKRVLRW